MFTCLASARLKNVTRWVRRGADDCSSNFLYSSDFMNFMNFMHFMKNGGGGG